MSKRRIHVIGAGKRVLGAVLPVLDKVASRLTLAGLYARTDRIMQAGGAERLVRSAAKLGAGDLQDSDLIYLAVAKASVPEVLASLCRLQPERLDLLIEPPVVLFRHLRAARLLERFQSAGAAEDCVELPWLDLLRAPQARALVGEPRRAVFLGSAYRYHALATIKRLFACETIRSARRRRTGAESARVDVRLANGVLGRVLEPRDYATGSFVIEGTAGSISDELQGRDPERVLRPVVADGRCTGFQIGGFATTLDADEVDLMGSCAPGASVTSLMEGMKRVGLLRLMRRLLAGEGAYPVLEALEDMAVDFLLEKAGFYPASPLTSVKSRLGRRLLEGAGGLLGRASRVSG
ncbi:MAG: hypothetical protein HY812_11860 [Planctomycetes bacterium]|nr:hypothetical protein [Planctomycetota bacterium]